jgi:hypothetical protein
LFFRKKAVRLDGLFLGFFAPGQLNLGATSLVQRVSLRLTGRNAKQPTYLCGRFLLKAVFLPITTDARNSLLLL